MKDRAKSVSKALVRVVTATGPRTRYCFREEESMGEDNNRYGEKEKHRRRKERNVSTEVER